jgi:uncharacterized repeat protein (TIGR01451 family)
MESIRFNLKQILAVVVSVALLSASVPPPLPAAIGASRVRPHEYARPWSAQPSRIKSIATQSATLALTPKLRSQFEPYKTSRRAVEAQIPVGEIGHDNPKPTTTGSANKVGANHEGVGKIATRDTHGLVFIENKGQFDARVKFQVTNHGKTLWLTENGIVFDFLRSNAAQANSTAPEMKPSGGNPAAPEILENHRFGQPALPDTERHVISQDFVGAKQTPTIETKNLQLGAYNYLSGGDSSNWQTQVRGYSEIIYHDLWKGVDLKFYGNGADLEQEFVVNPGADVSQVQIAYRGIENLGVESDGSLLIKTAAGEMRESAPRIYQQMAGNRFEVKGRFKLLSATSYTFEVAAHDTRYALVVDPTLLYSTFLGGSAGNNHEVATGIAVDAFGNAYVTGYTASTDFPVTPGAFQISSAGSAAFVTKLNPTGSGLVYSTYISGVSYSNAIAVDTNGNAYVSGSGASTGFPTTSNAYSQSCGASWFLTVLNPTGSGLVYSTCFGSGFVPNQSSMVATSNGRAFIAGSAGSYGSTIPTTPNAYQTANPGSRSDIAFASVFDTTASGAASLLYSTYFGIPSSNSGAYGTGAYAIAVDPYGNMYITGYAGDSLPVTPGAFQNSLATGIMCNPFAGAQWVCPDGFVAKFNPSASGAQSLIYSTYLGGPGNDAPLAIAVDNSGNAYVTGYTFSYSFPVTPGAFQTSLPYSGNVAVSFVSKLNAGGSGLLYSTYLAGGGVRPDATGQGIAVDSLGNAYLTGSTLSAAFPVTLDAFQSALHAGYDVFLTKLNPAGSALVYSSYLGGNQDDIATSIVIDQAGDAYITGYTGSSDFPSTPFAFQPALNPNPSRSTCDACFPEDAFVTKFPLGTSGALSVSAILPTIGGNTGTVTAEILGTGFHAGATASLVCGSSQIVGTNTIVQDGGRIINSTFSLTATIPSACTVTVVNPDTSSTSLPAAFVVVQGEGPKIQINKIGTAAVVGGNMTYVITASNIGDSDSGSVPITEILEPWFTLVSSSPTPSTIYALPDSFPEASLGQSYQGILEWDVSSISPGTTKAFTYEVKLDSTYPSGLPVHGLACEGGMPITCENQYDHCVEGISSLSSACYGEAPYDYSVCVGAAVLLCETQYEVCKRSQGEGGSCVTVTEDSEDSEDPNHLSGLSGVGAAQWVSGKTALSYAISFTNESTATASAQQVIVTDAIDLNSDLNTLQLTAVNLVGIQVPIPSAFQPAIGANEFATNVDLRPAQNLLVKVDATLDPVSRILTWTFTSIDPTTGQLPLDASVGFLPPGGTGNVFFTVNPNPGRPTGSQIGDQATILFDSNAPMSTPVWINSIDNSAPVSHVGSLPSTEPATGFTVAWSGTDTGAGIQDFTIFASDNGGPFTPFQTNTTATSAQFVGQTGHTYGFYSIARDLVGNIEPPKTAAETTTLAGNNIDTIPPITTVAISPLPNSAGWNDSNVTINLTAADNLGGSGVKQVTYSVAGAQAIPATTVNSNSASFVISTEGISTISFFSTDNAGNVEAPNTRTIKLDKTPPEAYDQFDPVAHDVVLFGRDSLSGVAPGPVAPKSVVPILGDKEDDGKDGEDEDHARRELRTYQVLDRAGNSLQVVEIVRKDRHHISMQVISLQYGQSAVLNLPRNAQTFEWHLREDASLRELEQEFQAGPGREAQRVVARFDAHKNQTIIVQQEPEPRTKVVKPGLDLLRMVTSTGKLSVEF